MKFKLSTLLLTVAFVAACCGWLAERRTVTQLQGNWDAELNRTVIATRRHSKALDYLTVEWYEKTLPDHYRGFLRREMLSEIHDIWLYSELIDERCSDLENGERLDSTNLAGKALEYVECQTFESYAEKCKDAENRFGIFFDALTDPDSDDYRSLKEFVESALKTTETEPPNAG